MKDVSIIIPVYNEGKIIRQVVQDILDYDFDFSTELIIINDASTDDSLAEINHFKDRPNIKIFSNLYNRGYGASLKIGIRLAEAEYICCYDGDGQFVPRYIADFFAAARLENLDAAIGRRNSLANGSPLWRAPGKFFIRLLINVLIGVKLKDFNCGLRLLKKSVIIKYLHLCSDRYSFSTTSTMILINRGYFYKFLPVDARQRKTGASSANINSGFSTIYLVLKMIMLFNPLKIFFNSGLLFLIFGFAWGIRYFLMGHGLSIGALFFLMAGTLLFFLGLIADQISELRKSQFEK